MDHFAFVEILAESVFGIAGEKYHFHVGMVAPNLADQGRAVDPGHDHVGQGLVIAFIGPHAASAERRAERRIMHGDHRAQTGTGIGRQQDLLVAVEIGKIGKGLCDVGQNRVWRRIVRWVVVGGNGTVGREAIHGRIFQSRVHRRRCHANTARQQYANTISDYGRIFNI